MINESTKSLEKFYVVTLLPLLSNLSLEEKVFISNRSQITEYNKGDMIYEKNASKDNVYIIITGKVELFDKKDITGRKKTISILRKGDYFGLISMLTGKKHTCFAKALESVKILKIDDRSFSEILDKIPALSSYISKTLSRRIKTTYAKEKKIYENKVIAVFCSNRESTASKYSKLLKENIQECSNKKVVCLTLNKEINSKSFVNKKVNEHNCIPLLDEYSSKYDYVIVDLPRESSDTVKKVLKYADSIHLIERKEYVDAEIKKLNNLDIESQQIKYVPINLISNNRVKAIARNETSTAVGIALGSGGALALAQIGVLQVLEREGVSLDMIAGTSMGAIIGSFYAAGYKAKEIQKMFQEFKSKSKAYGLFDIGLSKRAFVKGKNIRKFLKKYLGDLKFEETKIPLRVIACDIQTRQEHIISTGKVVDAVMASIAIPGIIEPFVTKEGKVLVDGGIITPLGVNVLALEGISRVIAVNSMPSPQDKMKNLSTDQFIFDIMVNSFYSMQYMIGKYVGEHADIYIHPILEDTAWHEFFRVNEFVLCGRENAYKKIDQIKDMIS